MRKLIVKNDEPGQVTLIFYTAPEADVSVYRISEGNLEQAIKKFCEGLGTTNTFAVAADGPPHSEAPIFFRNKPKVVQAHQYLVANKLVQGMCNSKTCYVAGNTAPHVHTIHDNQMVVLQVGDFILPEPDGEHFYPVRPEIFHATYEPI